MNYEFKIIMRIAFTFFLFSSFLCASTPFPAKDLNRFGGIDDSCQPDMSSPEARAKQRKQELALRKPLSDWIKQRTIQMQDVINNPGKYSSPTPQEARMQIETFTQKPLTADAGWMAHPRRTKKWWTERDNDAPQKHIPFIGMDAKSRFAHPKAFTNNHSELTGRGVTVLILEPDGVPKSTKGCLGCQVNDGKDASHGKDVADVMRQMAPETPFYGDSFNVEGKIRTSYQGDTCTIRPDYTFSFSPGTAHYLNKAGVRVVNMSMKIEETGDFWDTPEKLERDMNGNIEKNFTENKNLILQNIDQENKRIKDGENVQIKGGSIITKTQYLQKLRDGISALEEQKKKQFTSLKQSVKEFISEKKKYNSMGMAAILHQHTDKLFVIAASNEGDRTISEIDSSDAILRHPLKAGESMDHFIFVTNLTTYNTLAESSTIPGSPFAEHTISTLGTDLWVDGKSITGTSFSAPIVTGAAALILQAHPKFTPADVKECLLSSADRQFFAPMKGLARSAKISARSIQDVWQRVNLDDPSQQEQRNHFGRGVLNMDHALLYADLKATYPKAEVLMRFKEIIAFKEKKAAKRIQHAFAQKKPRIKQRLERLRPIVPPLAPAAPSPVAPKPQPKYVDPSANSPSVSGPSATSPAPMKRPPLANYRDIKLAGREVHTNFQGYLDFLNNKESSWQDIQRTIQTGGDFGTFDSNSSHVEKSLLKYFTEREIREAHVTGIRTALRQKSDLKPWDFENTSARTKASDKPYHNAIIWQFYEQARSPQ